MPQPNRDRLADLTVAHFAERTEPYKDRLIQTFLQYRDRNPVSADRLLNALHNAEDVRQDRAWKQVLDVVLRRLDMAGTK
ncbi:hypothetical protein [Streptosporangium sp. NPDC023615]|uniref:hypothetical protein n=1 Tax=Streptosporangium sp. NPDC023615 TaxID=3154794 RepID=UPI003414D2B3